MTERTCMHSTIYRFARDGVAAKKMEAASSLEAFLEAWCVRVVT